MGFVYADLEVLNPARRSGGERLSALVDTGATLTKVPGAVLKRLGIKPHGTRRFRLADGRLVRREVGSALFRIKGELVSAEVSFGRAGERPLIGVTLLESAGLAPDPVKRILVREDLLMM